MNERCVALAARSPVYDEALCVASRGQPPDGCRNLMVLGRARGAAFNARYCCILGQCGKRRGFSIKVTHVHGRNWEPPTCACVAI